MARNFVCNATYDGNKLAQSSVHTQTRTVYRASDHEVVRRSNGSHNGTQQRATNAQHQNSTMVTKRDTRYRSKYPSDAAAAVLVSNETHWYMLPILCIMHVYSDTQQMPTGERASRYKNPYLKLRVETPQVLYYRITTSYNKVFLTHLFIIIHYSWMTHIILKITIVH